MNKGGSPLSWHSSLVFKLLKFMSSHKSILQPYVPSGTTQRFSEGIAFCNQGRSQGLKNSEVWGVSF